jgi:hypothetical protein
MAVERSPKRLDDGAGAVAAPATRRRSIQYDEIVDLLIAYPHAFEVLSAISVGDWLGTGRSADGRVAPHRRP